MSQSTLKGSCLCGAVKYEVTGEPKRFYHCHCSRCRKATGTGHASNLFLQPAALKWLSGEEQVVAFKVLAANDLPTPSAQPVAAACRVKRTTSDIVMIPAGSLDDAAPIKPQANIFSDSRAGWSCTDDELPVYPEFPPQ
jgi:hypothetical protein